MISIPVQTQQSWPDLAVQTYGNIDALIQLLSDSVQDETEIDLADACPLSAVLVRENDPLTNASALRDLDGAIIATLPALADYDSSDYSDEYDT